MASPLAFTATKTKALAREIPPATQATYVLIKRVRLLTEKRTLKASFLFRKQRERESLAEVLFVIWQLSSC